RDVKLSEMFWNQFYSISGIGLQLTNNADQSRTFANIVMHEMKLYMVEATVPKGAAEPLLFVSGFELLDKDGKDLRYQSLYSHEIRSEEHTSELQSLTNLVCRLLLEKKKHSSKTTTDKTGTRTRPHAGCA